MTRTIGAMLVLAVLFPFDTQAHHSFALYDRSTTVEVDGVLTSFSWTNPHVKMTLESTYGSGRASNWSVDGNGKNQLERMKLSMDMLRVGDRVRVAGMPARDGSHRLYAGQILLADGREALMRPGMKPRWSTRVVGDNSFWSEDGTDRDAPGRSRGIFRVWSTNVASRGGFAFARHDYPMTESARAAQAAWNLDTPILTCSSYGMPTIMNSPDPVEFVDRGGSILLRIESFGAERTIHMRGGAGEAPAAQPLGWSVGKWDGATLVVTTTHLDWPHFDQTGIPLSPAAEFVERFTPSADGNRLDYRLVVTDPATFTEPVVLVKHWTWRKSEKIEPYDDKNCPG